MADIRFKDLTTTASSTASDDFIAVDGTTNGTRKLSAFSPTFGGNATVTGTLTVSGTSATVGSGTGSITSTLNGAAGNYKLNIYQSGGSDRWYVGLAAGAESGSNGGAPYTITALTDAGAVIDNPLLITRAAGGSITTPRPVSISATTASTSTSTGALVVGNGTSGGLGVGGAINAGSGAHVFGNAAANTTFTVSRITTSPSSIQLQAISSQALLDFTSETAAGYTWGRIASNGSEILRVHNSNLAAITPVSGGGLAVGGGLNVSATTASTSTSTGALVVSGGLGVGGAANIGGTLTVANTSAQLVLGVDSGSALTYTIRPAQAGGAIQIVQDSATVNRWLSLGGVNNSLVYTESLRITNGGHVAITNSTASTSTSSGALVVSGGVGVAGAIYAGGDLTVDKTEPTITFKRAANTNLNIVNFWTGAAADFGIGLRNTTDSDLHIYNYGTSNDALKIAKADSLATFGGAVRTAAPSGGTAANWKLGTVASVSPTSPNRTIEVDIGGTIYYIHAKTTNN